jgi:GLPGLI family protein
MKSIITITVSCLLLSASVSAQFTTQGYIEFERKVNVHRQFDDMQQGPWIERMKSQIPKFVSSYFDYYFTSEKTIYKPGRETENPIKMFGGGSPASKNSVLTNFLTDSVIAEKQVFEQGFLVQAPIRKMKWKLDSEVRTIAGYTCRKALGIICDSVYVVAFYTEDIQTTGGPEMFAGLPGMILEIAVPRLYTTWVATKVQLQAPKETDFVKPQKGKKVSPEELQKTIFSSMKDWGNFASRNVWWVTI